MKTYIYPENLRATVKLWFWNVRDFIIICAGIIVSIMIFAKLWMPVPLAFTACYAFLHAPCGGKFDYGFYYKCYEVFCDFAAIVFMGGKK